MNPTGARWDIRRGGLRAVTRLPGLASWHSLAFGAHYDPANVAFGPLIAHNHDCLAPGHGFAEHPHRDVEIVTWLLAGRLRHRDSTGRSAELLPGSVQVLSAGAGVHHSEHAVGCEPTELVQMWLTPDAVGGVPRYAQLDVAPRLARGELVAVASGGGHEGALPLRRSGAVLWAGRLPAAARVRLPPADYLHVYVAAGIVGLADDERLSAGDVLRGTGSVEPILTVVAATELLVWQLTDAPAPSGYDEVAGAQPVRSDGAPYRPTTRSRPPAD